MTARVLVVDDDEDIRAVLKVTLELAGFEVELAIDGHEGLEAARLHPPDAIVLDVMMPRMDGITMLEHVRSDSRISHVPVLLLTARAQTENAVEGLRAGADDYVTKPFEPDELTARVDAAIRRADLQRMRNPLTGLPGNERILSELTRRLEEQRPTALLYVDVDQFKPYNDFYGFMRGDEALQALAEMLDDVCTAQAEDGAFVGHVGGDDFVLIVDPRHAEEIAVSICERFDELAPDLYDPKDRDAGGIQMPDRQGVMQHFDLLSVSVGIATTERGHYEHHGELVAVATEMKRYAKTLPGEGSRYAIDRRTDGRGTTNGTA